ncbi:hypothetical protein MW7_004170 [Imbroritus primus]|uniref:Uncharacterized protein n=1 Tax=Imbroritus primus TaxID=3058603 RepID=A0ACD3SSK3_9BURK|nr:hypothetical protein MW7_004170 [Burkholderiaceae bacterium PBA]
MELHLRSHHLWEARLPDWPAAVVAGFVAGALVMVLELLWVTLVMGISPWIGPRMIAAMLLGPGVLEPATFNVWVIAVSLFVHFLLGSVLGVLFALVAAPLRLDSNVALVLVAGLLFGVVVYLVNIVGMSRVFTWFAPTQGWATFTAHLVFGMFTSWMYWLLERRGTGMS